MDNMKVICGMNCGAMNMTDTGMDQDKKQEAKIQVKVQNKRRT